jgi:hypothetical protein
MGIIQFLLRRGFCNDGEFDDLNVLMNQLKQTTPLHHVRAQDSVSSIIAIAVINLWHKANSPQIPLVIVVDV